MKSRLNFWRVMAVLFAMSFLTSCDNDDDATPGGGDTVSNGIYLVGTAADEAPIEAFKLVAGKVDKFPDAASRGGLWEGYFFLKGGSFKIVKYANNEATEFGGSFERKAMTGGGSAYEMGVGAYTDGGAEITSWEEGLHHVSVDETSGTFYIVPIKMWEIIGSATKDGWSSGQAINITSSNSAEEVVFQATEVTIRGGSDKEFKIRYNSNWNLDFTATIDELNLFTNFGGSPSELAAGGTNMTISEAEEGNYTITITYTPGPGNSIALTLERTGDAEEITYDPADFNWGIIGAATSTGWDSDTDVPYYDWSGNWVGAYYLTEDQFKFRANDEWAVELNPSNATLDGEDHITADGGNFVNGQEGMYFVSIRTDDEATTWKLKIKDYTPEIIGAATSTGWDSGTPMTFESNDAGTLTWSLADVVLSVENFKFRINGQWELQIGFGENTTIEGSNAGILSDGGDSNFKVGTAGTYQVKLSTADYGSTWTLTID